MANKTMMMMIQSQIDTVILSLGACRLYGESTRICNLRSLCSSYQSTRQALSLERGV